MSVEVIKRQIVDLKMKELYHNPLSCLIDSEIDINPHQIGAFIEAIDALQIGGMILADEVGLGKTIEAGLVLRYCIQNGYKNILLVMPSSLRKQWQIELIEKFRIDAKILDSSNINDFTFEDNYNCNVVICSYAFASNKASHLSSIKWELVVFDEAHKLRNVHKTNVKMAKRVRTLTKGIPKLMLTATPLQNTIYDLYGLVSFIDERIFLDKKTFGAKYIKEQNFTSLKKHIQPVLYRTLRKDVSEYISYRNRICITIDFQLTPQEAILYALVSDYLKRDIIYAIPSSNRNLVTMIIRKLLASSSYAVHDTFKVLKERLISLRESTFEQSIENSLDEFMDFIDDDFDEAEGGQQDQLYSRDDVNQFVQHEIEIVENIILQSESIKRNAKCEALFKAIEVAFEKQNALGIENKIVVFTESVRTQEFLYNELKTKGYLEDDILLFNGSLNDKHTREIYKAWKALNNGGTFNSRSVEIKHAVVEYFRKYSKILIVTDAGSEGLNLQFCNTVVNYDLPWNPQKIEQRIGRCHRYGQKNDVIVMNLLNTENAADNRVYEILSSKLKLFDGMFGTSDEALGLLESGTGFEKRVLEIYQSCQTVGQFNKEFNKLEKEFEKKRNNKFNEMKLILEQDVQSYEQNESVRNRVIEYLEEFNWWKKLVVDNEVDNSPRSYHMSVKKNDLLSDNEGYFVIGGFYDNSVFVEPVILAVNSDLGLIEMSAQEIFLILSEFLGDIEESNDNLQFTKLIDELYKNVLIQNEIKYKKQNRIMDERLENWVDLRREENSLYIEDLDDEIGKLSEVEKQSKVFKEKIQIRKLIETKKIDLTNAKEEFHVVVESIIDDAKKEKEKIILNQTINPVIYINSIIEFKVEEKN